MSTLKAALLRLMIHIPTFAGSEHTIDGKQSPLEMHIVTWNTDYPSFEVSAGASEGLAVIGILFEVSILNLKHMTCRNSGHRCPDFNFV